MIGADTRLTQGYEILSRNVCRLHELTSKCILGMGGCWTDMETVRRGEFVGNNVVQSSFLPLLRVQHSGLSG